ncbi:MAG: SUF system NifU family Fe-S cluster assembly protein [candidate division Zixibacteria bacterium]|nr:SUF system NifU family Fe-S cluster assembly protein [candidate division Zixibacteria bacterium]
MSQSLDDMYREIILDHFRSPRGKKPLEHSNIESDGMNPSCGDEISLQVEMDKGVLKDVHVNCRGCAISVASGSMLAETVKGKSFEEVEKLAETVRKMLKGESSEIPDEFGDLDALKGVRQFPVRVKCALLAWVTLVEGMRKYRNGDSGKAVISTEDPEVTG